MNSDFSLGRTPSLSLRFFIQSFALGALFQFIRGAFISLLLSGLSFDNRVLALSCYAITLAACGALLFFYDGLTAHWFKSKAACASIAGMGVCGILLARGTTPFIACVGMIMLAVFLSWAFVMLCSALCSFQREKALSCATLAFLLSFLFSFITQLTGFLYVLCVACIPIVVFVAILVGSRRAAERDSFFEVRPEIPTRFFVTIIILSIIGNFFSGMVENLVPSSDQAGVYWTTAVNIAVGIAILVVAKMGTGFEKVLYYCWFAFSLLLFAGIILLSLPSSIWLRFGSDLIATFRVALEFLLFLLIVIVASREKLHSEGLIGLFFLLPMGASILVRQLIAPAIAIAWGDSAFSYLPCIVMLITTVTLFSQYSAANKATFRDYFNPQKSDADTTDVVLKNICKGKGLTEREFELLKYLAKGYTMKAISNHLVIAPDTVRTHCRSIYRKLNVHSKQEIIDLLLQESEY